MIENFFDYRYKLNKNNFEFQINEIEIIKENLDEENVYPILRFEDVNI